MARISLKEAYDNRDVIAWLVKHEDEIDELMNILKDIDPNGDLTNVVTKTGDQTIDGIKTFIGKIVADCDIIQNGGNYETHAEQVFTTNDYIVMRDGAVSGLGTGQFSGFQVKKYNGSDDGRLVIDNAGVARVGDIGDEQPLATRDEASNMTSGALVKWDGVNEKMIAPASNIGSDTRPIKIVNGEPVEVTDPIIVNKTDTYIERVSAAVGGVVVMDKPVDSAGTYLLIAQIEVADAPAGTAILGIAKTVNRGWGISKTNTSTDYVRLTVSTVENMTATDHIFVNFYNGFGSAQTVSCKLTSTKLA